MGHRRGDGHIIEVPVIIDNDDKKQRVAIRAMSRLVVLKLLGK